MSRSPALKAGRCIRCLCGNARLSGGEMELSTRTVTLEIFSFGLWTSMDRDSRTILSLTIFLRSVPNYRTFCLPLLFRSKDEAIQRNTFFRHLSIFYPLAIYQIAWAISSTVPRGFAKSSSALVFGYTYASVDSERRHFVLSSALFVFVAAISGCILFFEAECIRNNTSCLL
jgi:hypothetical protein